MENSLTGGRKDIYFVTFRLADSLPQAKLDWLRREKELWLSLVVNRWLDAGYGGCILGRPDCKSIMESSLIHFDGLRYELGEFVVMPNHVHAIVAPIGEHQLYRILHSWKSFTAHQFNRILKSSGQIWRHESFDHIVRSG